MCFPRISTCISGTILYFSSRQSFYTALAKEEKLGEAISWGEISLQFEKMKEHYPMVTSRENKSQSELGHVFERPVVSPQPYVIVVTNDKEKVLQQLQTIGISASSP